MSYTAVVEDLGDRLAGERALAVADLSVTILTDVRRALGCAERDTGSEELGEARQRIQDAIRILHGYCTGGEQ